MQINMMAEWERLERLREIGDPLIKMGTVINWELFRPILNGAFATQPKGPGGRPPIDRVIMFKIVMLQQWYQIADDKTEYQINDRLSFQRFLGITLSDRVPDAKTIWAFKERLEQSGADVQLFSLFADLMEAEGIITREGSIVDASFAQVPRQRNTRKENETIKSGEIPEDWEAPEDASKLRQKDTDARWAKKNNETYFGFKNHIKVDADSKMIVNFTVTPANVHDSQVLEELLDGKDKVVRADSAYNGEKLHANIKYSLPHVELIINEKGTKGNPLTEGQKASNKEKSRIRARVEHVFGHMTQAMGGLFMRVIGYCRAFREIAMKNLAYNLQRYVFVQTVKSAK